MSYLLHMSGEIRDWLTGLRASDPSSARIVGAALTALLGEGASLGPPMVIALASPTGQVDPSEELDRSYQRRLEHMQLVRRRVAEAATVVKRLQQQIAALETLQSQLGDQHRHALEAGSQDLAGEVAGELAAAGDQVAELRRLLPGAVEAEQKLTATAQRQMLGVDAFRTRKEVLKATYIAALAEHEVDEALAAFRAVAGDGGVGDEDPDASTAATADRLAQVTREIEQELPAGLAVQSPGGVRPASGVMELRSGATGDSDVRILFAVEPPGTALLIAVLEDREAVRDHHGEAVLLASDILRRVRAGQAPDAAAHEFSDTDAFLDEFFPGDASEVEAGAAALVAGNRGRTLAGQRIRLGLTQAQVAERMSVRQERVSAIERAEPGATEIRTLAGYVEALGGRLEIIADFGGERVVLR